MSYTDQDGIPSDEAPLHMYPFPKHGTIVPVIDESNREVQTSTVLLTNESQSKWSLSFASCPTSTSALHLCITVNDDKVEDQVRCFHCQKKTDLEEMYECVDCYPMVSMCPHCAINRHNGHKISSLHSRRDLEQLLAEIKSYLPNKNAFLSELEAIYKDALTLFDEFETRITELDCGHFGNFQESEKKAEKLKRFADKLFKAHEKVKEVKQQLEDASSSFRQ
ncbi:hypothetical protein L596_022284 [Steinernema carpocapsae]|uniref:Uncharacterized protein n=1 Tax=Steinernema carpocapsae TaxID=34508 RepID=A0A4V6A0C4_STECR|nr:hypothetical protein L596_022284 [Steinernema carpocapsae]